MWKERVMVPLPVTPDVNTRLAGGVMHPTFSFAYCDKDSASQDSNPRKTLQLLEGESTEQAAIPPSNTGSSLALKGESGTRHFLGSCTPAQWLWSPEKRYIQAPVHAPRTISVVYSWVLNTQNFNRRSISTPIQTNLGQFPLRGRRYRF